MSTAAVAVDTSMASIYNTAISEASSTATFSTGLANMHCDTPSIRHPSYQTATDSQISLQSFTTKTCVVCMDNPKDITLSPCQHSHCCLDCFRRASTRLCPICRAPVYAVIEQRTGVSTPVSQIAPNRAPDRVSITDTLDEPVRYERPLHLHIRPPPPLRDDAYSARSSVSSLSVVHQAASSVRSLSRAQDEALRLLRQTGSIRPAPAGLHPALAARRCYTVSTASSALSDEGDSVMLIGKSRSVMAGLAHKLTLMFPPSPDQHAGEERASKSLLYIDGRALRLVLLECPLYAMSADLVARVQRQSPRLILLCADFFNLSSFESVVRLDMEVLDYLGAPCLWVLVKSAHVKRWRKSITVEDADVRTANHFFSRARKYVIVTVDTPMQSSGLRKLKYYMAKYVRGAPTTRPSRMAGHDRQGTVSCWPQTRFCFGMRGRSVGARREKCIWSMLKSWLF